MTRGAAPAQSVALQHTAAHRPLIISYLRIEFIAFQVLQTRVYLLQLGPGGPLGGGWGHRTVAGHGWDHRRSQTADPASELGAGADKFMDMHSSTSCDCAGAGV